MSLQQAQSLNKKPKIVFEKVQILDESTGQIIVKEQSHQVADYITYSSPAASPNSKKQRIETYQLIDNSTTTKTSKDTLDYVDLIQQPGTQVIILEQTPVEAAAAYATDSSLKHHSLINSGLSPHIVQNYSILAQEITAPLDTKPFETSLVSSSNVNLMPKSNPNKSNKKQITKTTKQKKEKETSPSTNSPTASVFTIKSAKDAQHATCQFCGLAMLKKNIPTHIRRAHTPKEELVCLNEEQNIFTFNYLKPGQRRKRSARAYDYSLMTATVSIDEDTDIDGIENKFITEGEEILSTDLLQLADRIKYGITQIPTSTLNKLIDILTKIEYSTHDEVCANAKAIRNMICYYMSSGEEFKYKIRQISEEIVDKKKQVNNLRADLKEVMTRKAQLERRIQPLVCDLQRLEDQHGSLLESISSHQLISDDLLHHHHHHHHSQQNSNATTSTNSYVDVEEDNSDDI